jgi:ribosomal protein S12 methylthiotransferase accessory factor
MFLFDTEWRRSKGFTAGTHRIRPPSETLREYVPLMKPLGITRLANVTGLDCVGLPVYVAIRPNSRSLSVSQGKGADPDAAKASALMETIELWHAERAQPPLRFASAEDLEAEDAAVELDDLPRRPGSEVRRERPMTWALGYDIIRRRPTYVPFEMVSLNLVGDSYEQAVFDMSSNGLASGNHVLEAVTHALCEVVERDSVTLAWMLDREALEKRKVVADSVEDEGCRALFRLLAVAGIEVSIWDATSDTGIPTFMAAIAEERGRVAWRTLGAFWGYGCHLAPEVALSRAVTEAAQARLTIIAGSRDDVFHAHFARQTNIEALKNLRERLLDKPGALHFASRSLATDSFDGDVDVVCQALQRVGIDSVIVVDLTRPEVGVPVVKVIVPGLEPYIWDERFRPGKRAQRRRQEG